MYSDPLVINDADNAPLTFSRIGIQPGAGKFSVTTTSGEFTIDVVQRQTKARKRAEYRLTMTKPIPGSATGAVDSTTCILAIDRPKAAAYTAADLNWLLKTVTKFTATQANVDKLLNGES